MAFRTFSLLALAALLMMGPPAGAVPDDSDAASAESGATPVGRIEEPEADANTVSESAPVETAPSEEAVAGDSRDVAAEPKSVNLETLLKNAIARNAEIKEAQYDVDVARAQKRRANAAGLPQGEAIILAAPVPEFRGNALSSTTNFGKWGPFLQGSVQLIQPLYTFGQIGNYKKAADHQVLAKLELADMKRDEIVFKTKEYYFGYLMASDLEGLVSDVIEILEEAAVEADKNLNKKKSKIKPHDVYQLKTELENVRQLRLHAEAGRKTAERAIAWVSATSFDNIKAKKIKPLEYEKKSLEEYLALSKAHRPEFKALREGQAARRALRDAKQAQSYPVLFFGGAFGAGWSPNADKQQSIFANDPFNRLFGGAGVGLRFDLEFWRHAAEAAEEEAERLKLQAKEEYAVPGIELEVKKAFWNLEKAEEGLEIADRRRKTARKWFVSNASGWTLGITPAKDLMDAVQGDALAKKNYVETIYSFNMALAELSRTVGVEVANLSY